MGIICKDLVDQELIEIWKENLKISVLLGNFFKPSHYKNYKSNLFKLDVMNGQAATLIMSGMCS